MKYLKNMCIGLLVLSVMIMTAGQSVFAADEEYTYTVRLYAGNQGALTNEGIEINSESASIASNEDHVVISGLKYGDMVYIRPQDAAKATDKRYHVKGVRRSGRDNSEAEAPTFYVACDRDYVVAYGVSGDMVAYTVNYVDEDDNSIMESDTYYGNIGERQYVSSRYIDGYQPQALNMVKTLSENAADNVFTFLYIAVARPGGPAGEPGGTAALAPGAAAGTGATAAPGGTGTAGGGTAGSETAQEPGDAVGGDASVQLPDENVPLDQKELVVLDDGEVPLDLKGLQKNTILGYLPVYIVIGSAAVLVLVIAAIYLKRRHRIVTSAGRKDKSADHKE